MTMDDALPIMEHLPLSFKTRSEQDYIAFLWGAFETSYTFGKDIEKTCWPQPRRLFSAL